MYKIALLRKLIHEPHSILISSIALFAGYILEVAYEKCIKYESQSYSFSHDPSQLISSRIVDLLLIWLRQKSILAYVHYCELISGLGAPPFITQLLCPFIGAVKLCHHSPSNLTTMTRNITKEQRLRKRHGRQRNERRISLMHKAYKYGTICNADMFLGIRLKENGHVSTFQSDSRRWPRILYATFIFHSL